MSGIDLSVVGRPGPELTRRWTERDTMLYALSVGAGAVDPHDELEYTTENSRGVSLVALPTLAAVLAQVEGLRPSLGDYPKTSTVHAGLSLTLHRPVPTSGEVRLQAVFTDVFDKGKGALAVSRTSAVDTATGELLFETESSSFIRGQGGFGGDRGPSTRPSDPGRPPDQTLVTTTSPTQALWYRLNADRNPLHSDPATARKAGFDRPILHGLCTYGTAVRAVLRAHDVAAEQVRQVEGRFSAIVFPGEELTVDSWREGSEISFRVSTAARGTALDGGRLQLG